jgi:maltodextrin utilization protein YvdJ
MILAAMFLVPIIPVGIAFANELTYPLDETVT